MQIVNMLLCLARLLNYRFVLSIYYFNYNILNNHRSIEESLKKGLANEIPEIQKAFKENQELHQNMERERKNIEDNKT